MPLEESLPHLDSAGRPTLRTVAALAGVHVSTASRVLAPSLPAGVRAASVGTSETIRRIAKELGFTPNPHASGLRTSRSHAVGVLVPHLTDIVLATIYEGLDEAARERGYQTFVANSRDDPAQRADAIAMLSTRRVDGLVLGDARLDDDVLASLTQAGTPFVLVSRRSGEHPSVTCDDEHGGRLAAEHLLALGHVDVAIVAGQPYASTAVDRCAGFLQAFAEAGHPLPAAQVVTSGFDVAGGREAADDLLNRPDRPSAIFAVNDFAAIGVLGAVRAAGLRAGRDVAVVGYNDTPLAGQLPTPLTSVSSPMRQLGRLALEMVLRRINGEVVGSRRLAPELHVRESSDPNALSRW